MEESEEISFSGILSHGLDNKDDDAYNYDQTEESDVMQSSSYPTEEFQTKHKRDDSPNDENFGNNHDENSPVKRTRKYKSEVKRFASKWILFSNENRPKVMKEFPQYSFPEIARTIAERYHNISAADSERLDDLVAVDRERYKQELAAAEDDPKGGTSKSMDEQQLLPTSFLAFPLVSQLSLIELKNGIWKLIFLLH